MSEIEMTRRSICASCGQRTNAEEINRDLLNALKALKRDREYQNKTGGAHFSSAHTEWEWKRNSACEAWALAETAIAKATGGTE